MAQNAQQRAHHAICHQQWSVSKEAASTARLILAKSQDGRFLLVHHQTSGFTPRFTFSVLFAARSLFGLCFATFGALQALSIPFCGLLLLGWRHRLWRRFWSSDRSHRHLGRGSRLGRCRKDNPYGRQTIGHRATRRGRLHAGFRQHKTAAETNGQNDEGCSDPREE
ncbi:hypothetical protein ACH79_29420 [Bradyrhizobium sp. CCBAU 051011]|nr:hypothetical protein ACH79_29420 [Bradyrhizobium sp. CCBAU 051011]